ncbi:protein-methionine-sulfoxide reductase heme-binding subunit MsrQ [Shewanella sp. NFH-SH190041]|uniref:protein-methionine-sulfoxide reductase heme-binding subunit MsrQ n=1 Tax=Shewanella sp. NFH-SH190041 TaxID=2950245 RepID=UPI0021C32756|nr:protein-methionine-sulfoxide reductase heme-binding subunit MsrQ [Shewanella sp. NFH-SH190041]
MARVFALKLVIHLGGLLPLLWLTLAVFTGELGADPVQRIIHFTGLGALNLLAVTLSVSPLTKLLGKGWLLQVRRLLGLYCFSYATLHILSYFALDLLFAFPMLFEEIVKRPYIILGATGYVLLLLLAITSINSLRRIMGRRWQALHNTIYLCAIILPIHFYWSLKSGWIEPVFYGVLFGALLLFRSSKIKRIIKLK